MPSRAAIPRRVRWGLLTLNLAFTAFHVVALPSELSPSSFLSDYTIRAWRHEQGLPNNLISALLPTREGYLWLGLQTGLARYDGLRFTMFNRANTPAMVNEVCQALAEDREGALWVGTRNGLLRRSAGGWTRYSVDEGLPTTNVWALCCTRDGSVWIGTSLGLARWQGGARVIAPLTNTWGRCDVMAFHEDVDGGLWIGTLRGLLRWDPRTGLFDDSLQPPTTRQPYAWERSPSAKPQCHVSGVFRDPAGRLWVASYAKPSFDCLLHCYDAGRWMRAIPTPETGAWIGRLVEETYQPVWMSALVAGNWQARLVAEPDGTVWIPTMGAGAWSEFRGNIRQHPLPGASPLTQRAHCLAVDREGSIWVGMDRVGLFQLEPRRVQVLAAEEGLPRDPTWSVCEARDGDVWIGTDGGVTQISEGRMLHFSQTNGLSRNEVRAVAETTDGTIWVGTLNGLDVIRNGQITHVRFPGEWFETKIRALLPARDGALWVGTVRGLTRLHNGQRLQYTVADGLGAQEVRALLEDRSGNLWVGTLGGGLSWLRDGKFTTLTTTNGLSSDNVWALHEDGEGALWIGTDRGLNRLKDGKIAVFTTREGLPDDLVNTVLEDDSGRLWIGQDRGIYWVTKQDLEAVAVGQARSVTAVRYDETDGLLSREVNGQKSFPATCKTRDGCLWIATARGVAIINPAKVSVDATPPAAVIEEVRASGETVFDNGPPTTRITNALPDFGLRTSDLKLPPGRGRVLEFRYTAGAFVAPEKVRFRYRMAGLSPNWIDVGTRREVFFTDLRPGDYEFELIAANHHGVWPDRGSRLSVHLAPHFYQTWWFYAVSGVGAVLLVGGIVAWRLRELRRIHRLEQQAAIMAERTRLAKDMHDGLGADLSRLTLLADLASGEASAHSGEHLRKLSRTSRQAARDLKELIWLANPANDTAEGLVSRLSQTAEDLLRDARIRCRLDLAPRLPEHPLSLEQRRNLLLVVREALNNIIKHAAATEVWFRVHASQGTLQLAIEDNGHGFDPARVPRGTLGLLNMRQRIENLGGAYNLESRPGTGTKIVIEVKLY